MTHSDDQLRQFLLRRLPEDQVREIEDAIILEDGIAERLRSEELDLLADYAAQRLAASECAAVERYLLMSSDARHSLRVAQLLARESSAPASTPQIPNRRPAWRFVASRRAAVAGLTSIVVLAVVFLPHWRTQQSMPAASSPAPPHSAIPDDESAASSAAPDSALPVLGLLLDVDRGSRSAALNWPHAAQVRLQVEVPAQSAGPFKLIIEDGHGQVLLQSEDLPVLATLPYRYVETTISTSRLAAGTNKVVLRSAAAPADSSAIFRWTVISASTR